MDISVDDFSPESDTSSRKDIKSSDSDAKNPDMTVDNCSIAPRFPLIAMRADV